MSSRNRYHHSGSVMVEFAGALVLLMLLVFGISEIGRAIYQLNTLTKSVKAGARYMSRVVGAVSFNSEAGSTEEQCMTANTVWASAVERATNIVLYGTENTGAITRLPNMEVTSISVHPRLDPTLSDGGACVIKISARARFSSVFGDDKPLPPFLGQGNSESDALIFTANYEERYVGE